MKALSLKEILSDVKMGVETRSVKLAIVAILLSVTWTISLKFSNESINSTLTFIKALGGLVLSGFIYLFILDIYLKLVSREFIYNLKQVNAHICEQYKNWAHNVSVNLPLDPKDVAHMKNLYYLVLNSNYFYFKLQIPRLLRYTHKMSEIDKTLFNFERNETSMDFITTMERRYPELIRLRKDAWLKDELTLLDNVGSVDKMGGLFTMVILFCGSVLSGSILLKLLLFILLSFCSVTLKTSLKNTVTNLKNDMIKEEFIIGEYDAGALVSLYEICPNNMLNKKWGGV